MRSNRQPEPIDGFDMPLPSAEPSFLPAYYAPTPGARLSAPRELADLHWAKRQAEAEGTRRRMALERLKTRLIALAIYLGVPALTLWAVWHFVVAPLVKR